MFEKVLVANRGAVASRVIRALRKLNIRSVAVYSDADKELPYLEMADERFHIGEADPRASYLNQDSLLKIMAHTKADGLHPGYGFLAENAEFAARVNSRNARFIGPSSKWIDAMGHKTRARKLMAEHGLPMGGSTQILGVDDSEIRQEAARLGYPILVKPAGGGGGIGMQAVETEMELLAAIDRARLMSQRTFKTADVYLERLLRQPRHVEFQILADRHGNVRHLFERDCSIQRRHQKIIEEAGAPGLARTSVDATAEKLTEVLARLGYDVIGTVETLYDQDGCFNFLEMNTRLQVEHAVTEEVTGIDIVSAQIRLAWGDRIETVLPDQINLTGHAIEARIYAEDPVTFRPSPGRLDIMRFGGGEGIRVETGYTEGSVISTFYDPMVAKVIASAPSRSLAIARLKDAIDQTTILGVKTNIDYIRYVLDSKDYVNGEVNTELGGHLQRGFMQSLN